MLIVILLASTVFLLTRYGRTALDAENRSPSSAYGKTSRPEQLADIEFFLNEAKKRFGTDSLFLYGHSMVREGYRGEHRALTIVPREALWSCLIRA